MNSTPKAALYCRLSKDDEQCGDSVSIETQKLALSQFCYEHNIDIFKIYTDDGYSGLNFNRPAFKRMIIDLENNKFDIVITKDLSRLGRDYIQTGYYIDIYFASKHIRYIAINDGIDTQNDDNDIAPFKNILNDMYAKDLSKKVKLAKRQRAQKGFYISAQPPYGYKVDPFNRNKLIIDEDAATVVKLIFDLAESGNSYSEISRMLEKREIICPSAYKVMNGDTRFLKYNKNQNNIHKWHYQTVRTIITNPVYTGAMVNNKTETINYKTKERVCVPMEKRIIVPDMHEAIISKERFNSINEKFSFKRSPNHSFHNIFENVVYCSECGTKMQLILNNRKSSTRMLFRCPRHFIDKTICTHYHSIYYDELYEEIQNQIKLHLFKLLESENFELLCNNIFNSIYHQVQEAKETQLQNQLIETNKKIKQFYRSNFDGQKLINTFELDALKKKQKHLIDELSCLPNKFDKKGEFKEYTIPIISHKIKEIISSFSLTQESLNLFVKKIEIGYLETSSVEKHQEIKIYYHF